MLKKLDQNFFFIEDSTKKYQLNLDKKNHMLYTKIREE